MKRSASLPAICLSCLVLSTNINLPAMAEAAVPTGLTADHITPYVSRFGRTRPIIAIIGENSGTEVTDFLIPYGVLKQSNTADVFAVSTQTGPLTLRPALTIEPDATIAVFDQRFPHGADYVIVPAVNRIADPTLIAWISAQAAKGATIISICDGALVVANTGLMNGRKATAHWATKGYRRKHYPKVLWQKNVRYVVDGKIVSSAGISASMPTSLALVEAIAGQNAAAVEAKALGVKDWSPRHNSEAFEPRLGVNLFPLIAVNFTNGWFHKPEIIGVSVDQNTDEIALAFTADAWSRTGMSRAYVLSTDQLPITTKHGLIVLPDSVKHQTYNLKAIGTDTAMQTLDDALSGIAKRYGRSTAYGVALDLEYPGFRK
jgi:putative intracellular protease/amidase